MKICVPKARPRLPVLNRTPASLLEQVRRGGDQQAWERFVQLYTPLLYSWARRVGLQEPDAADLVQEVFALLVQKLPQFAYDRHKSFRAYLHTITLNKWREHYRRRTALPLQTRAAEVPDPAGPDSTALFEEMEYQQYLMGRVLKLV
jgi:RNA polymerase sigma-70 factor (ECF subfamily)